MYFGKQKFLVAGLSRSGEGCVNFLIKHGATVYAYDDVISDKVATLMKEMKVWGVIAVDA